ncbi:MAG: L,D-transpeptidase family protein [Gammaproteobacteria bacterium]
MPNTQRHIEINIGTQTLLLKAGDEVEREYSVSTAGNGAGEKQDSYCTPRGKHIIAEKIGAGCEENTVFVGRRASGDIYRSEMAGQFPERDWILTRILWLSGQEPGVNQGGDVDTYNRYIYIHGAPDETAMGVPGSIGCIRMRNRDVMELFELVDTETAVLIKE